MVNSISIRRLGPLGLSAALALSLAACSSSGDILAPPSPEGEGGPATSNLMSSASNPQSGDATLTATATLVIDADGGGFDELTLRQTLGETGHEVVVTWDTTTHDIRGASHVWGPGQSHGGPTSGFTACFAGVNDCERVTLDFTGHKVTFTSQVLDDVLGGASTSTLSGTAIW